MCIYLANGSVRILNFAAQSRGSQNGRGHINPGTPRIYAYELAKRWRPHTLQGCSKGLAATEVWVHLQLLKSDCMVKRPEETANRELLKE